MSQKPRPEKPCTVCGRPMQWRKRWRANWAEVKYCSDKCRRSGRQREKAKI